MMNEAEAKWRLKKANEKWVKRVLKPKRRKCHFKLGPNSKRIELNSIHPED